jgi:Flp pilus assembly protein TadD
MLRKDIKIRVALSLAQSLMLLLGTVAPMAAYAAPSAGSTEARLEKIENSLLGRTQKGISEQERLSKLEVRVFGSESTGSTKDRLAKLDTSVDSARLSSSLLAPAMTPQLDTRQWSKVEDVPVQQQVYEADVPDYATKEDSATAMLKRATDLYAKGKTAEAESVFKKVVAIDSQNADAHFNLGAIAEARGDTQAALREYRIASQINPSDPELKDAVSQIERKQNANRIAQDTERQQREAQQREGAQRDQLKSMIAQASTAYKNGQYDSAVRQLDIVVKQAPNDPDVHFALAQALKAKGDLNKSRLHLNQALAVQPNNKLYRDALSDLDQRLATNDTSSGSRGGSGSGGGSAPGYAPAAAPAAAPSRQAPPPSDYIASSNGADTDAIVPFAPTPGYSSSASSSDRIGGGGFLGGSNSRIKRAALGGITGAAMGAMWGSRSSSYGSSKGNVLKGALMGGMLGILTGGL